MSYVAIPVQQRWQPGACINCGKFERTSQDESRCPLCVDLAIRERREYARGFARQNERQ